MPLADHSSRGGNIGLEGSKWCHVPKHVENLREKLEILRCFQWLSNISPSILDQTYYGLFFIMRAHFWFWRFYRTKSACNQCAHWRWLLVIIWWQHKKANSLILYNCKIIASFASISKVTEMPLLCRLELWVFKPWRIASIGVICIHSRCDQHGPLLWMSWRSAHFGFLHSTSSG